MRSSFFTSSRNSGEWPPHCRDCPGSFCFWKWSAARFFSSGSSAQPVCPRSHLVRLPIKQLGLVHALVWFFRGRLPCQRLGLFSAGELSRHRSAGHRLSRDLFLCRGGVLAGLIFFALHVRPLAGFGVVKRHRALLQHRLTRGVFFVALITWVLQSLDAFSLRAPLIDLLTSW